MKATELRIGNWVRDGEEQGRVMRIEPSLLALAKGGLVWGVHPQLATPIPLDETVLAKCGFSLERLLMSCTLYTGLNKAWHIALDENGAFRFALVEKHCETNERLLLGPALFTSLHQFQNFYFAFEGHELTYTP